MKKNYYNQYNPSDQTLEMTYNLFFTDYGEVPYFELSTFKEGDYEGFSLPSNNNQEKEYIRKELFQQLSAEAKEVIDIIINAPTEILELITTSKFKLFSKNKIRDYFHQHKGWKKQRVDKVFREITNYVDNLED